jgi:hypothetical protein
MKNPQYPFEEYFKKNVDAFSPLPFQTTTVTFKKKLP